ncbi:MAG TPA: hypothetical protein VLJ60_00105 [bacterium]|nr:hypothetical protein [bacterium]
MLKHLVLLVIAGGSLLFFMTKWSGEGDYDRFQKAREYSEYYKEFFVELPLNYKVFDDMPLVIRATNRGSDFWNREFYGMIRQSENEVNEILSVAKLINETHNDGGNALKYEQNLSSFPALFELFTDGTDLSGRTLFNLACGEIFEFWERETRNYKRKTAAYAKAETVAGYLFDNPSLAPVEIQNRKSLLDNLTKEKAEANVSKDEVIKKIRSYADESFAKFLDNALKRPSSLTDAEQLALLISVLKHIKMHSETSVLPRIENLKSFIPYAKVENIQIDEVKKSVRITNPNTSVPVSFFREALFMKKLKEKLPKENFHYLIFIGDRHGMWSLPEKFMRWSVSIDDPYAVTNKARGAVKLMAEEGFFVVTRKNEELILLKMDDLSAKIKKDIVEMTDGESRNRYMTGLRKDYPSRKYLFDPVKINVFERYDTPVDWRSGASVEKNLSALVIDSDPVKARMLSYSLFISDMDDVKRFESEFPSTVFSVLKYDDTLYVPEKLIENFMTLEDIEKAKLLFEYRSKGLNPDGSVPEKK